MTSFGVRMGGNNKLKSKAFSALDLGKQADGGAGSMLSP